MCREYVTQRAATTNRVHHAMEYGGSFTRIMERAHRAIKNPAIVAGVCLRGEASWLGSLSQPRQQQ